MSINPQNSSRSDIDVYKEHVKWLETALDSAREENETLNIQIHNLYKELDSLTPLRKHVKRQVRHHLVRADKKLLSALSHQDKFKPLKMGETADGRPLLDVVAEYDRANFTTYNQAAKTHFTLSVYKTLRSGLVKAARRLKARRGVV